MNASINYYALTLSILSDFTVDKALGYFGVRDAGTGERPAKRDRIDAAELTRLKEKMTYRQVGDIYGLTPGAVYNRVRRFRGNM